MAERQGDRCALLLRWVTTELQVIEIYLHLVVEMRDHLPGLPEVVLIKNSFFYTKLIQEGYVYNNGAFSLLELLLRERCHPATVVCSHAATPRGTALILLPSPTNSHFVALKLPLSMCSSTHSLPPSQACTLTAGCALQ